MALSGQIVLSRLGGNGGEKLVHGSGGIVSLRAERKVEYHQERGLALNPNYDLIVVQNGELYTWTGRAEEGAEWIS